MDELDAAVGRILKLYEHVNIDARDADGRRVDEVSFRRCVDAAATSLARNVSGHPSDQLAVLQSFKNRHRNDPDLDKEIQDVEDQTKIANTKMRFRNAQKKFKVDRANADAVTKKELDQRLLRIKNAPQKAIAVAKKFADDNPGAIRFHPIKGAYLSRDASSEYKPLLRKFRGDYSDFNGSLSSQAP